MNDNITTIGRRIRSFRESKGLTQQELELAIEASFGHICRIESGKINPSKETLTKIAEILNLNLKEKSYLLGLVIDPVSENEVQHAIQFSKDYLNSTSNPVYLADDFWFTWWGNNKMFDIIGAPGENEVNSRRIFIRDHSGIHILEWLFDFKLGVRQLMPKERWSDIALNQCIFFINFVDYFHRQDQDWVKKLIYNLEKIENFNDIWEKAKKNAFRKLSREETTVTYIYNNDWYEFFIANTMINNLPRFMVVEYIPCVIYKNGDLNNQIKI